MDALFEDQSAELQAVVTGAPASLFLSSQPVDGWLDSKDHSQDHTSNYQPLSKESKDQIKDRATKTHKRSRDDTEASVSGAAKRNKTDTHSAGSSDDNGSKGSSRNSDGSSNGSNKGPAQALEVGDGQEREQERENFFLVDEYGWAVVLHRGDEQTVEVPARKSIIAQAYESSTVPEERPKQKGKGRLAAKDQALFDLDSHTYKETCPEYTHVHYSNNTPVTYIERPLMRHPNQDSDEERTKPSGNGRNQKVFRKNRVPQRNRHDLFRCEDMDRVLPNESDRQIQYRLEQEERDRRDAHMDQLFGGVDKVTKGRGKR